MPASIVHMLISRKTREELRKNADMKDFLATVLDKYPTYMELGSLGPDLPYFKSLLSGLWNTFINRSDKPMGIDQWSYQLHSKTPNLFPLRMLEITWKETDPDVTEWDETDKMKFAFLCGFLAHMAADQVIHPVVNHIAGPYYKTRQAREEHRTCEVHEDLYAFSKECGGQLTRDTLAKASFASWCTVEPDALWTENALWFRYVIQKAFVEAHAVTPTEKTVGKWIRGTLRILRYCIYLHIPRVRKLLGPYGAAYQALFGDEGQLLTSSPQYKKYVALETCSGSRTYDDYFADAVELASVYIRAAFKVYSADELDTQLRKKFRTVIHSADLGAPLEKDILKEAKQALADWDVK
jgi:hypothetical protein